MGVDTRGVVLTHVKDVFAVLSLVDRTLQRLVVDAAQVEFPGRPMASADVAPRYKGPDTELMPALQLTSTGFRYRGEQRNLRVLFSCDCDHQDLAPQSLSLLLGYWGHAPFLMQAVLQALSVFGPAYYDENDSDTVDLKPLDLPRPTYLDLVKRGFARCPEFERWVRWHRAGYFGHDAPLERTLGMSARQAERLLALPSAVQWDEVEALAVKRSPFPFVQALEAAAAVA